MRWSRFFLFQLLLVAVAGALVYLHKESVAMIRIPPASLAQWYQPQNERQVWLHTMFNLRREMQAVKLYADNRDAVHMERWVAKLSEHYLKIGEMVPEWNKKLDREAITRLQESSDNSRYEDVTHALDALNKSCKSCHTDFRAVTAAMYRAPDFSSMEVDTETPYKAHMKDLVQQVNQIKIASEDGMQEVALSSLADLEKGINLLGKSCVNCHKKDTRVYPGETINKTIASLGQSLQTGTLKEQGRDLGTLAVLACARCHGTHRIAYDTRDMYTDRQSLLELIRH